MGVKAKESPQILKARQKIKKQLAETDKKVNPEALKLMRQVIERQIARHASQRISLKKRQITLFDENQHPAQPQSKFVMSLLSEIKEEKPKKGKKLLGRIVSMNEEASEK